MSRPRRVGIIGLGAISAYYLAAVERSPRWELAAVCDPREAAPGARPGPVPHWREHTAMLREAELDAVVAAVPNHVHAAVCGDALAAGVPVCVEKPLALSVEEGRGLADLSGRTGVPLFTAFHRRYNDAVRDLRRRLAGRAPAASLRVRYLERIEEHLGGEDWYLDPERCGGGCLADNGPNAFDLVRYFLGEVTVSDAELGRDGAGTDRQALVGLRAPGGATAVVELDWSFPGEVKDVEVRLADGEVLRADMLAGHDGFKASLWHEYEGILADFAAVLDAPPGPAAPSVARGGLAALELVADAYGRERALTGGPEGTR